jgi:pimeloyl-ACP methyl ester carboxylesterase
MTTRHLDVQLADGRVLRVDDHGAIDGATVFFLHGTPGSRLVPDTLLPTFADTKIRVISYDRPGYGGSTPQPGRIIANGAADVAAIADELDVERFAVWGVSGGGPHALACAALLPDRVVAAAAAPTFAPYQPPELAWFAGMAEGAAQLHNLATLGRDALQQVLPLMSEGFKGADPAGFVELSGPMLSPPDRAILDASVAAFLLAHVREGLMPGAEGWVEDQLAFVAPWGLDLASVQVPVAVWCGELDGLTPAAQAHWVAGAIPGAELHLLPNEGHFSLIFGHDREVTNWLAEQLRRSP